MNTNQLINVINYNPQFILKKKKLLKTVSKRYDFDQEVRFIILKFYIKKADDELFQRYDSFNEEFRFLFENTYTPTCTYRKDTYH